MRLAHEVAVIRAAEAAVMSETPAGTLMQRAAAALAATCGRVLGRVYGAKIVLLVGSGDNGGDALFCGALLARRGAAISAVLLSERSHVAGLAALRAAGGRVAKAAALDSADLVIDGIVGIGGRGGLRDDAVTAVARIPASATVISVDVPSGVDADTGEVAGAAVRAHATVTFGTWKAGLLVDPGASYAGAVECIDIGLRTRLPTATVSALQGTDVEALLPVPSAESDKYRRGVLGIVAGSRTYTGAAVLATGGALRAGVGMVRFVSVPHPAELVRTRWPETVVTELRADGTGVLDAGRVQAWVVGPGLGTDAVAETLVAQVLSADVPVVVDADGLTILGRNRELLMSRTAPTVLTPHAGELVRVLALDESVRNDIEARRLYYARTATAELGATVLLKGSTTVICSPSGLTRVNPTGTPWLATAGSGDVLSGMTGALLAGGLSALDAASCAAYLHGCAARLAAGRDGTACVPIVAEDVVAAIAPAIASLGGADGG
jgi:ADP-dependent NAD(P)H-hydrate dehydratase / NAD(P)H-hydrate epimerase